MARIIVATDGSSLGNPGPAGWSWIVSKDNWAAGGLPRATNQVAELYAILSAIRTIPSTMPIRIRTDSQFAINVCTKWLPNWKKNNWCKADGNTIANLRLVQELDRAIIARERKTTIEWEWVRGHNGNRLNEIADKRCTDASSAIKTGRPVPTGPGWTGNLPARGTGPAVKLPLAPQPINGKARPTVTPTRSTSTPAQLAEKRRRIARKEDALAEVKKGPKRVIVQSTYKKPRTSIETKPDIKLPQRGMCPSCNTPIDPMTMECRCSD